MENTKKVNTWPLKGLWAIEKGKPDVGPNGPMFDIFPTLILKKASMTSDFHSIQWCNNALSGSFTVIT